MEEVITEMFDRPIKGGAGCTPGYVPPKTGKGSTLTDKQKLFCEEYVKDLNATRACIRAGYTTKAPQQTGTRLLYHPLVQTYLRKLSEKRAKRTMIDQDYVLNKLIAIVEDTESGNPQAALRGLELLGKHLRMFVDRQEVSGPDGEAIQMEQKVKENADDFESRIARLASRDGTAGVVELPVRKREGGT